MIAKLQRSLVEKGAMSRVRCSTKVSLRKLHKNWDIKKIKYTNKGWEMNIFCKFVAVTSGKKKTGIDSNTLKNSGERASTNV